MFVCVGRAGRFWGAAASAWCPGPSGVPTALSPNPRVPGYLVPGGQAGNSSTAFFTFRKVIMVMMVVMVMMLVVMVV